ncbi:MAG: VOC family protein [Balneolaceae bacterium]|nr:VOC family protein [Balneolaceae bacterium]MCH8548480.1 VOC family protein [Balneolaceae bacterium]
MNFRGTVKGLHHVSATVNRAQEDVDFYTELLGQRLVKETVNFDNEKVYHFYYGNEIGSPSTIFTTFPYGDQGVREGVIGNGQVYETAFTIPKGSLGFWKKRLKNHQIQFESEERFRRQFITFEDPSGLKLSLLEDGEDQREPVWIAEGLSIETAIPGIHHVTIAVSRPDESIPFLEFLGYEVSDTDEKRTLMEASEKGAGNSIVVLDGKDLPKGVNGLGTVHHVAHRVPSVDDSLNIKKEIKKRYGIDVTEVKDRKYFKSIYFRIPGDVVFEIATEGPGFLVDEEVDQLGTSLKLPDWQEPRREKIESELTPYKRPSEKRG